MSVEVGSNLMNSLSPQRVNEKILNAVDNRSCTKPAAKVRHLTSDYLNSDSLKLKNYL